MGRYERSDICTIYLLINKINNKIYVGQTWAIDVADRMGKGGSKYSNSPYLYNALKSYGSKNFEYTILVQSKNQEDADYLEDYFINFYNSRDLTVGYNLKTGGSAGKHTEETKQKISETLKNKEWSPEALEGRASGGRQWAGKERGTQTEERREYISQVMIDYHKNNPHPMLGKHHTEEAKEKISQALKGQKRDPKTVKKSIQKLKMSDEKEQGIIKDYLDQILTIRQICDKYKTRSSGVYRVLYRNNIKLINNFSKWEGKTHSEETKQKMTEQAKKLWQERKDKS